MRKGVIAGLVLFSVIFLVSVVYAHPPGGGWGTCLTRLDNADINSVKKFQKETLPLRDELVTKRLEIREECRKENPDRDHIANLRKEMIDIRTELHKKADALGISSLRTLKGQCGPEGKRAMHRGYKGCSRAMIF
jgi:hypothetical protein